MLCAPATILKCPTCADVLKLVRSTPPVMPTGSLIPDGVYQGVCICGTHLSLAFSSKETVARQRKELEQRRS